MLTDYYSVAEVAKSTQINYHTLLARIRNGQVAAQRVGKMYFIHKDDAARIQPPTPAASRARG